MSTLTSYKDGSLGSGPNMSAIRDGSLGQLNMQSYENGSLGNLNMSAFRDGSLGCGCGVSGIGTVDFLDTTPKKIGAAAVVLGAAWFFLGKKKRR